MSNLTKIIPHSTIYISIIFCFSQALSSPLCIPRVKIAGPEQIVFNYYKDRCNIKDTSDISNFAFIDKNNQVQLLIGISAGTYRDIGSSLKQPLKRDCTAPVLSSNPNSQASAQAFYNRVWPASPWTADGQTIYLLIHNEYQGWKTYNNDCYQSHHTTGNCWYPNIIMAKSIDAGKSYQIISRAGLLGTGQPVIATPYRYDRNLNGPQGIATQSNIISRNTPQGTFYYILVLNRVNHGQAEGQCIFRSNRISDPTSWRGWDGHDFMVNMNTNSYFNAMDESQHLCQPIFKKLNCVSWTYNTIAKQYMALCISFKSNAVMGMQNDGPAFAYTFSKDMIHWTEPRWLKKTYRNLYALSASGSGMKKYEYPSVLDPSSKGRNFEYSGAHPYLYYTRFNPKQYGTPWQNRDVLRVPLEVSCR